MGGPRRRKLKRDYRAFRLQPYEYKHRNVMIHRRRMVFKHTFNQIGCDYGLADATVRIIVFNWETTLQTLAMEPNTGPFVIAHEIGCDARFTPDYNHIELTGDHWEKEDTDG